MKKTSNLLALFLLIFFHQQSFSQELPTVIPPSPEASSLTGSSNLNVGLFSGTLQYSLNIYNLEGRNLSVPISLNYSTNGVRVNDISSWVGLGWSLSAGGSISRTIYDDPDENAQDILDIDTTECLTQAESTYLNVGHEFQADLFTCNVLGQSFEFYLDNNNIPYFTELSDWTITYNSTIQEFILKDTQGNVYVFGGGNLNPIEFAENVAGYYTELTSSGSGSDFKSGITAWYLKSITHHTGEQITFEYRTKKYSYDLDRSQTERRSLLLPYENFGFTTTTTRQKVTRGLYLDKITTVKDQVTFNSVQGHIGSKILTSIEGAKKKIDFDVHKYNSNNRYFLEKVTFKSSNDTHFEDYEFEYKDPDLLPSRLSYAQDHWGYFNDATNATLLVNMPIYFPHHNADREVNPAVLDYGTLEKITFPTKGTKRFLYESNHRMDNGIEKHFGGVRIKRITTHSDRRSRDVVKEYEYPEAEVAHFNAYIVENIELIHPLGAPWRNYRNSSSREKEEFGTNPNNYMYTKVIEYLDGREGDPKTEHYFSNGQKTYIQVMPNAHYNSQFLPANKTLFIGKPKKIREVFYRKNNPNEDTTIYYPGDYSAVKEKIYYSPLKELDTIRSSYFRKKLYNSPSASNAPWYPNWENCVNPLFPAYVHNGEVLSGSLISGISLQKYSIRRYTQKMDSIKTIDYDYSRIIDPATIDTDNDGTLDSETDDDDGDGIPDWFDNDDDNDGTINSEDDDDDNDGILDVDEFKPIAVETTVSYEYNQHINLATKQTVTTSNSDEVLETTYQYPPTTTNIASYISQPTHIRTYKNINGQPLLTSSVNNVFSSQTVFNNYSGSNKLMSKIMTTKGPEFDGVDFTFEDRIIYHDYDAYANPLEVSKAGGTRIIYVWGYDNTLPIAKIENASYDGMSTSLTNAIALAKTASNADDDNCTQIGCKEQELRDELENLRNHADLSGAMVTTYTYDPLIGITSVTDPKGYTMYYEYDEFNRLEHVRDKEKNIMSKTQYNYLQD